MSNETDYTETWEALEQAEVALDRVRAVHLTTDEHEKVRQARHEFEKIRERIDSEIEEERENE